MAKIKTAKIDIEVVNGVEGPSLYIDNLRVAGNKPWGGGDTVFSWRIDKEDLIQDLITLGLLSEKDVK